MVADNEPSDLIRREADIAIRNVRSTEADLIARYIRDDRAYLYVTPSYLSSIGNPNVLEEFANVSFISFTESASTIDWLNNKGMTLTADNSPIITKNYLVHWELVKRGLGSGIRPLTVGDKEPLVVRACPAIDPFDCPIWLVSHRELKTSRRVRIVFDLLVEMISQER